MHVIYHVYCMYTYIRIFNCVVLCLLMYICRKKGAEKQSMVELASKFAELAAKLPEPPVAGTEHVISKIRNGASDQPHKKPSLLPAVPGGKLSVVSPVHSRESVAQCEKHASSSNSPPLPPVIQQSPQPMQPTLKHHCGGQNR